MGWVLCFFHHTGKPHDTLEQEFVEKEQAVGKLKNALRHLVFPYQFVVIDCPPSLGFLTFNALFASDMVIIPIELGSFALYGVAKLLSMIELIRVKMSYAPRIHALPTMIDMRSRFSKNMMAKIRDTFRDNIFETSIRTSVAFRESQLQGVPVFEHDPQSRAAQDYMSLANEIISQNEAAEESIIETSRVERFDSQPRVKDFSLTAPAANEVYLVGDFNHWRIDENSKLWKQGNGLWQKRVVLPPGKYRYKFVVDGRWVSDPHNQLAESNPYGGIDSVAEVA